jgi:hypothetical protein
MSADNSLAKANWPGLIAEMLVRTYFESQGRSAYFVRELIKLDRKKAFGAGTKLHANSFCDIIRASSAARNTVSMRSGIRPILFTCGATIGALSC